MPFTRVERLRAHVAFLMKKKHANEMKTFEEVEKARNEFQENHIHDSCEDHVEAYRSKARADLEAIAAERTKNMPEPDEDDWWK